MNYEEQTFLLLIFSTILLFSCKKSIKAGSSTTVSANLDLNQGYLQLYEKVHQNNSELPIRVMVSVDNLDSDMTIESNFRTYTFNVNNNGQDPNNFRFDITVPDAGSFGITTTATGLVCFDHCNNGYDCDFGHGKPFWREMQTFVNSNNNPPTYYAFFYENPFVDCL